MQQFAPSRFVARRPGDTVPDPGPARAIVPRSVPRLGERDRAGFGPLAPFVSAPDVTDVFLNGPDEMWIDRGAGLRREHYVLCPDIYRCGVPTGEVDADGTPAMCGAPLRTAPHGGTAAKPYQRRYLYRCTARAHLSVRADQTDDYVLGVVADLIRDPRVAAAMHPGDSHLSADRERRSALTARLEAFERDYALGTITGAQLQKATAAVGAELIEVDARLAKALRQSSSSGVLRAADPGSAFLAAPIDVRRAVLATVLRVEVVPQEHRGTVWTPARLRLSPVA